MPLPRPDPIICDMRRAACLFAVALASACASATSSPSPQPSTSAPTSPLETPATPTSSTAITSTSAARLVRASGNFPVLSPDGTTLISKSQGGRGGATNALVFESIDGKMLRRIPDDRASGRMQWLPDSSAVFVELAAGQRAGPLGIVSADGSIIETGLDYANPALSPDGKWIAAEHQEGCCVGIRIREIWVAPRSGGAPRLLVTSSAPQDALQPIALLGWDAQGGALYRDGDTFARVTLGGARTTLLPTPSMRGRAVTASAVSPDNAVIVLCTADPLGWWTLANGTLSDLPQSLRPAWRLREPWCSGPDEVPWYGAHDLVLKDVAGKTRTYDPVAGGDRPFPLVSSDALLAASTYILLAAVGQDIWIMSGTGGLPTGLQSSATDLHISSIDNSRFFVQIGTGAYVVAVPQNASRDPSWKNSPELRVPRPAFADNNVRCGLIVETLTRPGEGMGGTVIAPVVSAAYGVTQGELVGLPTDAPPRGSYVCLRTRPGAPMSGFGGWVQPGQADYVPRSALVPTGFALPQSCSYRGDPAPDEKRDGVVWRIDCGSAQDTRTLLAPALTQQAWTLCGSGSGVGIWTKDDRTLTVTEAGGDPGSRPTLNLRPNSDCP